MRVGLVVVVCAVALAGCGSAVEAQKSCTTEYAGYLQAWSCIRAKVAAGQAGDMNNDLAVRYLATGDAIAEQVRAGQMTDAQAKMLLGNELVRGNSAYESRQMDALIAQRLVMR